MPVGNVIILVAGLSANILRTVIRQDQDTTDPLRSVGDCALAHRYKVRVAQSFLRSVTSN